MTVFHMFSPRPTDTISSYWYSTQADVSGELARRVDELVYGITWEGPAKGETGLGSVLCG
ncbi:MAG TPA: hypothetical protein VII06_39755 [Chloroflexota bacterium]